MTDILVLNGPNLSWLGKREPELYGNETLTTIEHNLQQTAKSLNLSLVSIQSDSELSLIQAIESAARENTRCVIFNPGAFTHSSIALRDCLLTHKLPFIEVHLSSPARREHFRQKSYFSDLAIGTISGFGMHSYLLALRAAANYLDNA